MNRHSAGSRARRAYDDAPPLLRGLLRGAGAAGLGLLVGLAFSLPVLTYMLASGRRQTVMLLLAAVVAILIIRRTGRLLRQVLDGAPQPSRLPLLGLYGLAAMAMPAVLLLQVQPVGSAMSRYNHALMR